MANHNKPIQDAPPPSPVKWATITKVPQGWCFAHMTTVGGKMSEQHVGPPGEKDEAEEAFRIWTGEHLMGWEIE